MTVETPWSLEHLQASAARLNVPGITAVNRIIAKDVESSIFPQINKWNQDNYGPVYIPQKEKQSIWTPHHYHFKRIITDYEKKWSRRKNDLK
jgi:signal peptidase I